MEYLRLTKTLVDFGCFVKESEIASKINSTEPFYKSLYYYPEEGLEYFKKHGRIKGYKGKVSTNLVTFDIDSDDLEISRINMIRLVDYLKTIGMYREMAAIISFSGSKGYHLDIKCEYEFDPKTLKKFCVHIGKQVDFVKKAGFKLDPVVYNTNRIFRITNTVNEKSGLYKVNVTETDLREKTTEDITKYAQSQREQFSFEDVIPKFIVEDVLDSIKEKHPPIVDHKLMITPRKSKNIEDYGCYLALQNGEMKAGESNSGLLRLAQFYKDAGYTIEQCRQKLVLAAHARMKKYPETNEINDEKLNYEILGCIYGGDGYTYGASDDFLKERCVGKCLLHNVNIRKPVGLFMKKGFGNAEAKPVVDKPKIGFKPKEVKTEVPTGFKTFNESAKSYKEFASNVSERVIKTGIAELDKYVKILPTGITFINARPSVGKTSILLNMLVNNPEVTFLFYCADMVEDEFFEKAKSKILKISPDEVRELYSDENYAHLREKADKELEGLFKNVHICYDKALTVERISRDVEYFKSIGQEVECICIDYVQKIKGSEDYGKGVQNIMELKVIQDTYKLPIIGMSQIPRIGGDEETPVMTAGAGKGGSIYEETGSVILNMWRPLRHAPEHGIDNTLMVYVAKNRMGQCPQPIPLHFDGATSEVRTKTPQELEEFEVNFAAYQEAKRQQKKITGKFR